MFGKIIGAVVGGVKQAVQFVDRCGQKVASLIVNAPPVVKATGVAGAAYAAASVHVLADPSTNFPAPIGLLDQVSTPFNTALGWVIGATAVLLAIRWIKKAAGR